MRRRDQGWFADRSTTSEIKTKTNYCQSKQWENAAIMGWNIRSVKTNMYALTKAIKARNLRKKSQTSNGGIQKYIKMKELS